MGCLGHCRQGRRNCPTPIQCGPREDRYTPYVIGTLVTCLLMVIGLALLVLYFK